MLSHDQLKQHLDARFDRVEDKIDNHLERISKAEEAIVWMRGHIKIVVTMLIGVLGSLVAAYFR